MHTMQPTPSSYIFPFFLLQSRHRPSVRPSTSSSDCGTQLRKEDPATLKDIIATIQTRTKPLLVAEDAAALSGGNGKSEVMSLAAKFQVGEREFLVVAVGFGFGFLSRCGEILYLPVSSCIPLNSHCFTKTHFLIPKDPFPL